jgi:hypothetical protein
MSLATVTLQQQGLSLYIMESRFTATSCYASPFPNPEIPSKALASEPYEGEGRGSARLASVTEPTDETTSVSLLEYTPQPRSPIIPLFI